MLISVEHLLAEREERLCRYHVVLEHDDLLCQREGPLVRTEARRVAALVMVEITTMHLALPIYLLVAHDLATGHDTWLVTLVTWSVLIEQEHGGPCLAHSLEDLSERVAASEEQQQNGYVCLGGMLHNRCKDTNNSEKICVIYGFFYNNSEIICAICGLFSNFAADDKRRTEKAIQP